MQSACVAAWKVSGQSVTRMQHKDKCYLKDHCVTWKDVDIPIMVQLYFVFTLFQCMCYCLLFSSNYFCHFFILL